LAVLTPPVTAGLIVAYLTDGRFKVPKDATVEIVPGETVTNAAAPEANPPAPPGASEMKSVLPDTGTLPATELQGAPEARRPLPRPTTPQ
jgi:hypothetical protein